MVSAHNLLQEFIQLSKHLGLKVIWYPTPADYAKWGKKKAKVRKRSTGRGADG